MQYCLYCPVDMISVKFLKPALYLSIPLFNLPSIQVVCLYFFFSIFSPLSYSHSGSLLLDHQPFWDLLLPWLSVPHSICFGSGCLSFRNLSLLLVNLSTSCWCCPCLFLCAFAPSPICMNDCFRAWVLHLVCFSSLFSLQDFMVERSSCFLRTEGIVHCTDCKAPWG